MLVSILVNPVAKAEFNSIEECVQSCDYALQQADITIEGLETRAKLQEEYSKNLEGQVVELKLDLKKAEDIAESAHSQTYIWGAVGIALGALAMGLAK
jgi:hypothetical protein